MSQENEDLATHVMLCDLRYKQLEERIHAFDTRLSKMESEISSIKTTTAQGFTELKLLLERNNSARQTQLMATIGTVVASVCALIGFIITRS
tara:strand:+ start:2473 stop:2748 length:276 start_codon:yes stop_codon:yes gene_type:complete